MTFTDFALHMYPYWILGAVMGWTIWKSDHKDLLSFNKKSFVKFSLFMLAISIYRFITVKIAIHHGLGEHFQAAKDLPIGATFMVGWEDLCHSAPLVLLGRMIGVNKWTKPIHVLAMFVVMVAFMLGHLYEGLFAATLLSMYIPFGVSFGQRKGFGTLICSHMLYDFMTLMTIRLALG